MTDYRPDAGPSMEDNYRSTIARLMGEMTTVNGRITALLDENAALKRDNEQHAANYREVVGLKCELQERFDQLATQFTTAEASRDALAGKLKEVAEIISGYGTPGEKIGRIALITGNATIARSTEK